MNHIDRHILESNNTILAAIKQLDEVSNFDQPLTLFICDSNRRMVGTLTDGDIRRGFIKGLTLDSNVSQFMVKDFTYVRKDNIDLKHIRHLRKEGISLLPCLSPGGEIEKVYNLNLLKSLLPIECMIMAGGRGERLRPLTDSIPKPMLMLGDKPIIEHNIDRLIEYGIEKIYISIKYKGEQIRDYLGDGSNKGITIEYVEETTPLGTGGALGLVESFNTDHVLLMNSDLLTDIDFEDLYLETIEQNAEIGIASTPYTVSIPYAIFEKDNSQVLSFKEKPNNTHYANAGIYIIKKIWINEIPKDKFYNITDLIQLILDNDKLVIHNPIPGYWIDIGKHEDFEKAKNIMKHLKP